jgi:predicted transcriptional regulator
MLRTTVYLDETTESELRVLARKSGRSKAELIREALRTYVAKARSKIESELPPGVGRYSSSRDDVSERADVLLWVDAGDDA